MKLPKCLGYKIETMDGTEYDCNGLHDKTCEDCLVLYNKMRGLWNPNTGKKINKILAFILYRFNKDIR
jgi:hypothetical protein